MTDTHQNTDDTIESSILSARMPSEIRDCEDSVAKNVASLPGETRKITFFIPGIPGTAGSKKFVGHAKSTGRAILVDSSGAKGKTWRLAVQWSCREAMKGLDFSQFERGVPLFMRLELIMPRPKYHFTSKGKLKDTAPYWHTVKPDTTKMLRAAEDALKDILWHDDGQVALQSNGKRYGNQPGAQITVMNLIHPMTKEDHE